MFFAPLFIFKKIFFLGRVTVPGFTPYSMSKFAAVAFADGLRREMKKWGVSVHVIEPSSYKYELLSISLSGQIFNTAIDSCLIERIFRSLIPFTRALIVTGISAQMKF